MGSDVYSHEKTPPSITSFIKFSSSHLVHQLQGERPAPYTRTGSVCQIGDQECGAVSGEDKRHPIGIYAVAVHS